MRMLALVLVILGALALGFEGASDVTRERVDTGLVEVPMDREKTVRIPLVIGGIAVVGGLLLLAITVRRD